MVQEYKEYLKQLNEETEDPGSVSGLEQELNQLLAEEAELMQDLQVQTIPSGEK